MTIRFEEWRATERPIMESELPPGVRYKLQSCGTLEFVAAEDRRRTVVRDAHGATRHYHGIADRSPSTPVTILDWPSWCAPRPDTKSQRPTLSEAVKQVGTDGKIAVVARSASGDIYTFDGLDIVRGEHEFSPGVPGNSVFTFLGYLIEE